MGADRGHCGVGRADAGGRAHAVDRPPADSAAGHPLDEAPGSSALTSWHSAASWPRGLAGESRWMSALSEPRRRCQSPSVCLTRLSRQPRAALAVHQRSAGDLEGSDVGEDMPRRPPETRHPSDRPLTEAPDGSVPRRPAVNRCAASRKQSPARRVPWRPYPAEAPPIAPARLGATPLWVLAARRVLAAPLRVTAGFVHCGCIGYCVYCG